jgi:hypothetical protein
MYHVETEETRRIRIQDMGLVLVEGGKVRMCATCGNLNPLMDEGCEGSSWDVDGVIGKSLFDRYVADIDYEAATLTFYEPAESTLGDGVLPIPLELRNGMPVLKGSIDTNGKGLVAADMLMDLGHSGTLAVDEMSVAGIGMPVKTLAGLGGMGVQGKVMAQHGRVRQLRFGDMTFQDLPATYHPEGKGLTGRPGGPVNIGSQVWRRFRIVLDYPGKRLLLVPNSHVAKPFPFNMAGLSLRHAKEGTYLVVHVIPGTPAHEQGLQVGDRITSLDGKAARDMAYQQVVERFSEVGQNVEVVVQRGGETLKRTLTLRKLI